MALLWGWFSWSDYTGIITMSPNLWRSRFFQSIFSKQTLRETGILTASSMGTVPWSIGPSLEEVVNFPVVEGGQCIGKLVGILITTDNSPGRWIKNPLVILDKLPFAKLCEIALDKPGEGLVNQLGKICLNKQVCLLEKRRSTNPFIITLH